MTEITKPIPAVTPEMEPFFAGAARGELWIQRCADCGTYRFPARELCATCLSAGATWERACGRGVVYAFTIMHQVYHPAFAAEVPYAVVIIQLAEGPKLTSNLVDVPASEVCAGMPVEVVFERYSETVVLPKFRRATNGASAAVAAAQRPG